jgi:hypothetical protein
VEFDHQFILLIFTFSSSLVCRWFIILDVIVCDEHFFFWERLIVAALFKVQKIHMICVFKTQIYDT